MSDSEPKWFINEDGAVYSYDPDRQAGEFPNDDHTPYETREAAEEAADNPPEVAAVVETMSHEVEDLLRRGEVLLSGPASVQLYLEVEDAGTPVEAADKAISYIARNGFNSVYLAVTDKSSGEDYYVKAGQLVPLGLVEDEAREAKGEDDD